MLLLGSSTDGVASCDAAGRTEILTAHSKLRCRAEVNELASDISVFEFDHEATEAPFNRGLDHWSCVFL